MNVVILGASSDKSRYAYKAAERLLSAGHHVTGVNPKRPSIPNVEVVATVGELAPGEDTLTIYVSPAVTQTMSPEIVKYGFRRVIFNPGAENPALADSLRSNEVEVVEACTLVMLATGTFDR